MKNQSARRLIGVLGGMGPAATIDFMARITANTIATHDQEHVPLLVHSVPQIPDRSSAIQAGNDGPFEPMRRGIDVLVGAGARFIAIPCNTAHFWHARLSQNTPVPILHIADAVIAMLTATGGPLGKVAIMATRGTIACDIYHTRLTQAGAEVIVPHESIQQDVDASIAHVKGGRLDLGRIHFERAACALMQAGADRLLLACTELPVACAHTQYQADAIDCTDALARACVAASLGQLACVGSPDERDDLNGDALGESSDAEAIGAALFAYRPTPVT